MTANKAVELANKIATAVFMKLGLQDKFDVVVRRHGEPVAMPWIEIAWRKKGQPPESESCVSLPEHHYLVETKEERTQLATYLFKTTAMMLGKYQAPEKGKK